MSLHPEQFESGEFLAAALDAVLAAVIGMLGGVVNYLNSHKKSSWQSFLAASVTAAFAGVMSHFVTDWLDFDIRLRYAISGAAGYSGGIFLDYLLTRLLELLKQKADQKNL